MKSIIVTCCILFASLFNTACTSILPDAHKIDIQQGNAIKSDELKKLTVGMSKKQVLLLLGTPIIRDVFHDNRWDYVYTFKNGGGSTKSMRLTLYFKASTLSEIDNVSYVPEM
ncbi:MAG: outer membrane protein assembly factor BamE [Gammaproteobacteria bacterium]|nr:outer membrane protein assembly factor BamE [Gammaproteobacteria bacterium]